VAALAAPSARAIHGSRPHPHGVSTGCQSLNHMVPWHRQEGNAQQDENTRADAAYHPLGTHARPCSGARARRGRRGLSCSSHQHAFTAGTLQNHTAPVVTVRAPWRPPSAAALGRRDSAPQASLSGLGPPTPSRCLPCPPQLRMGGSYRARAEKRVADPVCSVYFILLSNPPVSVYKLSDTVRLMAG
jgi:hypothetical protein